MPRLLTVEQTQKLNDLAADLAEVVADAHHAGTDPLPEVIALVDGAFHFGGPLGRIVERLDGPVVEALAELAIRLLQQHLPRREEG